MNIFNQMHFLFSRFLIVQLFFFVTCAYPSDFKNEYSNFLLYDKDSQLTNYFIADVIYHNKLHFQMLNKTTAESIGLKISEFYYEEFYKKNKFILGKKKVYVGNSLFFNISDILRLYNTGNNSYPDSMKRIGEEGELQVSYTRLLNNGSIAALYYPEKKVVKLSISSELINENLSSDLSLYGSADYLGIGLNISKLIGDSSIAYLEASYINKLEFEQYQRKDNLYIIPGFQYTLNNGITLNIEYLYHNNDITVDDIMSSKGKITSKNLDYLATKSKILFFNINKIQLGEKFDLMLSLVESKKHNIRDISTTIKYDANDSVFVYGKLTKKIDKKGLGFFMGMECHF